MRFLVTAKQECGGFDPWSGHAVIDVTAVRAEKLQALRRLFLNTKKVCELEELRISGWYARFYSALHVGGFLVGMLTEYGYFRFTRGDLDENDTEERTELDRLIVTAEGFRICCELKNTDQYVVTSLIPYEALK